MMNLVEWVGPLCAFSSSLTWAIGSTQYSKLSQSSSPFAVNFSRALIGFPLAVLTTFFLVGSWSKGIDHFHLIQWRHIGWFSLSVISSFAVADPLFLLSAQSLGVPTALAIGSCFPLWTVLAGTLFLNEKLSLLKWMGVLITLSGVIVVILCGKQKQTRKDDQRFPYLGLGLAGLVSLLWASNMFALSRGGVELFSPVGTSLRLGLGILLIAFFSKIFSGAFQSQLKLQKESNSRSWSQPSLFLPLKQYRQFWWVFVLEAYLGSFFSVYGLAHSPLALGTILSSLAPVLSVPIALIAGSEKFSLKKSMGILGVAIGITLLVID